ncbi:MAG: VOC family protein [Actinomycetota bacterium]|nr:VOC family protein [Actinomycetota bacterium]
MELGAFSVSLPVADLAASQAFYETLGFEVTGGEAEQNWLIMVNGTTVIGLFHGMLDAPILTFNPGLSMTDGVPTQGEAEVDVREIEAALRAAGIEIAEPVEPGTVGPGHLIVMDPDGNPVMIDQF